MGTIKDNPRRRWQDSGAKWRHGKGGKDYGIYFSGDREAQKCWFPSGLGGNRRNNLSWA